MVFTNLGNYLFIPVYKIPDMKWKELGKHVNNIIMLQDGEKVLTSYIYKKNKTLVLASKEGMVKRTLMSDFEVQRCNKPMTALKLKANDELVSVNLATDNILFITANGYYLNYKSEELPIVGTKASGVKGISLKEDQLITTISYDDKTEYVTLFTDNKTAKRVKISDLETHSRAKKGSTILKKTKTVTYKVITAFGTSARDLVLTKVDSDINILKNSDIAIMDLASTGSNISKYKLDTAAKVTLKEKIEDNEMPKKEEKTEEPKVNKALSIADFIDDFKL